MTGLQWMLELLLIGLLLATLFHALRLERALGVLKRDRAALEELVAGFNGATRQAEKGIDRLRDTADGAGRQIARQIDVVSTLKEDLAFLIERGDRLADRIDGQVRTGRGAEPALVPEFAAMPPEVPVPAQFKAPPPFAAPAFAAPVFAAPAFPSSAYVPAAFQTTSPFTSPAAFNGNEPELPVEPGGPRVRSQAERDLLRALRMAR